METKVAKEVIDLNNNYLIFIGIIFITSFIILFFLLIKTPNSKNITHFNATFNFVDGINIGSKVSIAGIKIGEVTKIELTNNNQINLIGQIHETISIPSDSLVQIDTNGIFGDKYLSIIPGFDDFFNSKELTFSYSADSYTVDSLARYIDDGNRL